MKKKPTYKRILIKLSGEVMAGGGGVGIEPAALQELVEEIKELRGLEVEIAVVIGGGNLIRGAQAAQYDLERMTFPSFAGVIPSSDLRIAFSISPIMELSQG